MAKWLSPGARAYFRYARAMGFHTAWEHLSHEERLAWALAGKEARRDAKPRRPRRR